MGFGRCKTINVPGKSIGLKTRYPRRAKGIKPSTWRNAPAFINSHTISSVDDTIL